jgi:hypothetical protein
MTSGDNIRRGGPSGPPDATAAAGKKRFRVRSKEEECRWHQLRLTIRSTGC